jgi:hypothetical protein
MGTGRVTTAVTILIVIREVAVIIEMNYVGLDLFLVISF